MGRRLILWDIDGTLVSCGPAAREALEAGARLAGELVTVPHVVMSGKTDRMILREILTRAGMADDALDAAIAVGLVEAEANLRASAGRLAVEGRVHPGVREAIKTLNDAGAVQTVVTGNLKDNAHTKLSAFGLDEHIDLDIGAFGSDEEDRNVLVPLCLSRAARRHGELFDPHDVWVIGDTHRDLDCARAAGVRCLLVGTGRGGLGSVAHLPADYVFGDLSDTVQLLNILVGGSSPP